MVDRANNNKLNKTINNIIKEVENNIKVVKMGADYHREVAENVNHYIDSVDIRSFDKSAMGIIGPLIPYGLQVASVQNVAWTMAVETETISLFDYDMAYDLTQLYDLQNRGVISTTNKIMDLLTNPALFDINQNAEIVNVFQFAMQELASQEFFLIEKYEEFLEKYKKE